MTEPTPIILVTEHGGQEWPYSLSAFVALDAEMRTLIPCTNCHRENRMGDMVDRSTFKIVTRSGIRCRKVRIKLQCPQCGIEVELEHKSGPVGMAKAGEPDSPIEMWRKWSGLPPLI